MKPQLRIPAVYMRGGTSKGVFFLASDLPADPAERDRLLLRVVGSPDPYGQHIDGMGGATSSTSKVVLVAKSQRPDADVDYWFGAVAVAEPVIDWSGNCGNLSAAVGPFAISAGLLEAPHDGLATVRIWQANLGKHIVAHVPIHAGEVLESGDFELDGVAFPAAEIRLTFVDPGADEGEPGGSATVTSAPASASTGGLFPTGRPVDVLHIPGLGALEATLINAGNPTIFVEAAQLGLSGTELQPQVNHRPELLALAESVRAHGAVAMGLATSPEAATAQRPHTPKLAFVARPAAYRAANGKAVSPEDIDVLARIFSMGRLHHAMTGTGAVAIAAAAAIPGTLVHRLAPVDPQGRIRFGHPSGVLSVGAHAEQAPDGRWRITQVTMSRSARRLMEGWVRIPVAKA